MKRIFLNRQDFQWIDIENPSKAELEAIVKEKSLPESSVRDCLDPKHLPKFEKCGSIDFLIVRVFDPDEKQRDVSVQNLTRKVAIFLGADFVLTIHRAPMSLIDDVQLSLDSRSVGARDLVLRLLKASVVSFDSPMDESESKLDKFENLLFKREAGFRDLQELHSLRRKVSLMKRLQLHHSAMFQRAGFDPSPAVQDFKETLDHAVFFLDELLEDVTSLLSLQLAVASHRTSEVVRILTVFSVFFLPLTFIVGIYGMNFRVMPEIDWRYGYGFAWAVMILVTIGIAFWFKKRGWMNF